MYGSQKMLMRNSGRLLLFLVGYGSGWLLSSAGGLWMVALNIMIRRAAMCGQRKEHADISVSLYFSASATFLRNGADLLCPWVTARPLMEGMGFD